MPHEIEAVSADIIQASEGSVELRFQRCGIIRAIAREKSIFVAKPFALDGNRIVEPGRRSYLGEKPRP
jgi:hypothetical protein